MKTIAPIPIINTSELKSVTWIEFDGDENFEVDFFESVRAIRKATSAVEAPSGNKSNNWSFESSYSCSSDDAVVWIFDHKVSLVLEKDVIEVHFKYTIVV